MSVRQVRIIDALKNLIANRRGTEFQHLATQLAKIRYPDLVASEPTADLGSDAYLLGFTKVDGNRVAVAASLTAKYGKIRDDCRAIRDKQGDVDYVLFYTPVAKTRKSIQSWSERLKADMGIALEVIERTEIVEVLRQPAASWLCDEYLELEISDEPDLHELRKKLLNSSRNALAGWVSVHGRHLALEALAEPRLERRTEDSRSGEPISLADLKNLVVARQDGVLLGAPGAGKTVLLFQLADALLNEHDGPVPVLVSAASWAASGRPLMEFVAGHPTMQADGLTASDLARLSRAGSAVFLVNGWNEISQTHLEAIAVQLREERKAHPPPGLVVVSRSDGTRPHLTDEIAIDVLDLTNEARAEFIKKRLGGDTAAKLIQELDSVAFLDDLTKTPLFLSAALAYHERHGAFPKTAYSALEGLVETAEEQEPHKFALQQLPIRGHHRLYMAELAYRATAAGEVVLPRTSTLGYLVDAARQLSDARQIVDIPEPDDLAKALAAHHLLIELAVPESALRFSHQQVQEWFAALYLRSHFFQQAGAWKRADFDVLKAIANERDWEYPLLLLVEHLADVGGIEDKILEFARLTLAVDLVFACSILNLAGRSEIAASDPQFRRVITSCYASPSGELKKYGLTAMLASGSKAFADVVWPLLENDDDQVRLRTYRLYEPFPISCLGPQWNERIAKWDGERRAEFVWEVFMREGHDVQLVREFAEGDPEPIVRAAGIQALHWRGRMKELEAAVCNADDKTMVELAKKGELGYLPGALKKRLVPRIIALLRQDPALPVRLQMLGVLMDMRSGECLSWLKENLEKENVADWARRIVEYIGEADPKWLAHWMAEKIVSGTSFHSSWLKFLRAASEEDREKVIGHVLRLASSDLNPYRLAYVGRLCLPFHVERVLAEHFALVERRAAGETPAEGEGGRMQFLFAVASEVEPDMLVDCILKSYRAPASDRIRDDVLRLLTHEREHEGEQQRQRSGIRKAQLTAGRLAALQGMLRAWCEAAVKQADPNASLLSSLASALALLGEPSSADLFLKLVDRDVERIEAAAAKQQEWLANGRRGPNPVPTHYDPIYVRAALDFDGRSEYLLLRLLQTPGFEGSATGGLVRLTATAEERETRRWRSFDPKAAMAARKARMKGARDHDLRKRLLTVVRARLVELVDVYEKTGALPSAPGIGGEIRGMLVPFCALANESDLELIARVLGMSSKNSWTRVEAIEHLVQKGIGVPFDMALPLLEPVVEEVAAKQWIDDQSRGLARRALCVLLMCGKPDEAVASVRKHLPLIGTSYDTREFVEALGAVEDEAADALLLELMQNETVGKPCAPELLDAMQGSRSERVKRQLLDWLQAPESFRAATGNHRDALSSYSSACAAIATRDDTFRQALFDCCEKDLAANQREILASILHAIGTEDAAYQGCLLIADNATPPAPGELGRLLEEIFSEHKPAEPEGSSYNVYQRACNRVRERLFEMAVNDERRKKSALSLLISLENRRRQLGRPREEPRHPALATGMPWPLPGMR